MMRTKLAWILCLTGILAVGTVGMVGCEDEEPNLDQGMENLQNETGDAANDVGDAANDVGNQMKDSANQMGDQMKSAAEDND